MKGRGAAAARLHLLGIRHHGPGSACAVLAALDALDPAIVLIEGPPEADPILHFASAPGMTPPVALLVHRDDDPAVASFFPFAVFSPEWQALRWALQHGRQVRFADLPMAHRLAASGADTAGAAPPARRDPLGTLAAIAGYDDAEAWWNALIEEGAPAPTIFAAIEAAIGELRNGADEAAPLSPFEAEREAAMRLALGMALGETDGKVAVVCGAWHVPALRRPAPVGADRALLRGLPRAKVTVTWVPWTDTRLAAAGGYGAGVVSPGWYGHLWQELERRGPGAPFSPRAFTARWQARVAGKLRAQGQVTSTASVIDATRLAEALAALRGLPLPGLAEMREAGLSTLCLGEWAPWRLVERELVLGTAVGQIPEDVPQMPLLADLARWQRKLKLPPEALERDVSFDLRSEAGLAKSLLLHRLDLIGVPWGQRLDAGSSRGTFRENWRLLWVPEFAVRLAEALVHGTTIEQASGNAALAAARDASSVAGIAVIVEGCLLAGLADAARGAIALLQGAAAATSDVAALADAVPPLAAILRYGTAREVPRDELRLLVGSLSEAVCSGLVYACRNLQPEEAERLGESLGALNRHLPLVEDAHLLADWRAALDRVAGDADAEAMLRGFAVRALYDLGALDAAATAGHLSRALSPSVPVGEAGRWLDGFLGGAGQVLLYDGHLAGLVDDWLAGLAEADFMALLPALRRAFAALDPEERRRLLDLLRRPGGLAVASDGADAEPAPGFAAALPLLLTVLGIDREALAP